MLYNEKVFSNDSHNLTATLKAEIGRNHLKSRRKNHFHAGQDIALEGHGSSATFIILEGWMASHKTNQWGARQIIDFHITGDIIGLRSALFDNLDYGITSLTPVAFIEVSHADLLALAKSAPQILLAALHTLSVETSIMAQRLGSIGRLSAKQRMAHLFLELEARLSNARQLDATFYFFPASQYDLADALGISPVHVNRVLRDFREEGVMSFRGHRVVLNDRHKLRQIAGYDGAHMQHLACVKVE